MKKRTGNHTKTAAITAIALTAAVMAPAMTMRNTRGAQQENPSVGLEENAVWTEDQRPGRSAYRQCTGNSRTRSGSRK